MKPRQLIWLVLLTLAVLFLAGCTGGVLSLPVTGSETIRATSSFGQTFTAQNRGLSSVSILLAPSGSSGSLVFHLRTGIQSNVDLAHASIPLSEVTEQRYYRFDFPPQSDSQRKDYYLQVDAIDGGQVEVFTSSADSYIDGAMYENLIPQEAQLAFRIEYDRPAYLLGVLLLTIKWAGILLIGFVAFILPGWSLFSLLWRGWDRYSWINKLGLSAGLSLAIYPLFLLWTNLLGFHLGFVYAWLPVVGGTLALGWKNRKQIIKLIDNIHQRKSPWENYHLPSMDILLADLAFLAVLGMLIFSRMWVTRSLDVPLFGDSYQHTLITQLIIEHGGLFNTWQPYADLASFTYHFGFHSMSAVFHWITGASATRSVLWTGQLLNILAILTLYPLTYNITRNRWAGVIAMLVGGLISANPMTYINWGRYTQLAGQVILPAVILTVWSILEEPFPTNSDVHGFRKLVSRNYLFPSFGSLVISAFLLGGLALTHYRILILAVLFFPVLLLFTITWPKLAGLLCRTVWIGMGGMLLFAPWLFHIYQGRLIAIFTGQLNGGPSNPSAYVGIIPTLQNLFTYLPIAIWVLFVLSIVIGIIKWKKNILIFTLWWIFILVVANTQWLGLPGNESITNFAIFIAFYIPASVIVGSLMIWIFPKEQFIERGDGIARKPVVNSVVLASLILMVVCVLGIWKIPERLQDVKISSYALVTRPDLRAMNWIKDNTPANSVFLVNSFFAYNGTLVAGSDAGWWLPLLAERQSSLPPLTYGFEEGGSATSLTAINNLYQQIYTTGITDPANLAILEKHGIKYLYVGQRQGMVNYQGPKMMDPQVISRDPNFEVIYHQDRVWIFEIAH